MEIKDQLVATGSWPVKENPNSQRIAELQRYYRQLSEKEKIERERARNISRRNQYIPSNDKYGLKAIVMRKKMGLAMTGLNLNEDFKVDPIEPAQAVDEPEALSDDFYTKPFDLNKVTTIEQRLEYPEFQPETVSDMMPKHSRLSVKCSQRCRKCDHYLSKPEFNPSSIKFKIQLAAVYHVPEVKIMKSMATVNDEKPVVITILNPLDYPTQVFLEPSDDVTQEEWDTASVRLPTCALFLSARDDAAEFDEPIEQQPFCDDPKVVVFRDANKIAVGIFVTAVRANVDARISFKMRYDYKNLVSALQGENKKPEAEALNQTVLINLGPPATN